MRGWNDGTSTTSGLRPSTQVLVDRLHPVGGLMLGTSIALVLGAVLHYWEAAPIARLIGEHAYEMQAAFRILGVVWWLLIAWLARSLLVLVLRRTLFPHDNQPHARRLFADLASCLIYVVAFIGVTVGVLKQPLSTVFATSGVLAIVLGLALQSTLADVFSGIAINIERPFRSGDWVTVNDSTKGQVLEVNWRATRIKQPTNDIVSIPNSVVAKAVLSNHSYFEGPRIATLKIRVDSLVPPAFILGLLETAALRSVGVSKETVPVAYASELSSNLVTYEVTFSTAGPLVTALVRSNVIANILTDFQSAGVGIGDRDIGLRLS